MGGDYSRLRNNGEQRNRRKYNSPAVSSTIRESDTEARGTKKKGLRGRHDDCRAPTHNDTFLNRRKRYHKQDIEIILSIKQAIEQREKEDDNLTFSWSSAVIGGITGAKDGSSRFYKILHLGFFYKRSRYYPEHSKTLDVVKYSEDFDTLLEVYGGLEIKNFDKDIITHFNQTLKETQEQGV